MKDVWLDVEKELCPLLRNVSKTPTIKPSSNFTSKLDSSLVQNLILRNRL